MRFDSQPLLKKSIASFGNKPQTVSGVVEWEAISDGLPVTTLLEATTDIILPLISSLVHFNVNSTLAPYKKNCTLHCFLNLERTSGVNLFTNLKWTKSDRIPWEFRDTAFGTDTLSDFIHFNFGNLVRLLESCLGYHRFHLYVIFSD